MRGFDHAAGKVILAPHFQQIRALTNGDTAVQPGPVFSMFSEKQWMSTSSRKHSKMLSLFPAVVDAAEIVGELHSMVSTLTFTKQAPWRVRRRRCYGLWTVPSTRT